MLFTITTFNISKRLLLIFIALTIILFLTYNLHSLHLTTPHLFAKPAEKFAYVFYVTYDFNYSCFARINTHRLIFDLKSSPSIDIVILTSNTSELELFCPRMRCPFPDGRLKIKNHRFLVLRGMLRKTRNFRLVRIRSSYIWIRTDSLWKVWIILFTCI